MVWRWSMKSMTNDELGAIIALHDATLRDVGVRAPPCAPGAPSNSRAGPSSLFLESSQRRGRAQHMNNCFLRFTKFITDKGIKKFSDFHENDKVKDKDGIFREATIHKHGYQPMRKVTLKSGDEIRTVRCTKDHRWLLSDGSVTTSLEEGDALYAPKPDKKSGTNPPIWTVANIKEEIDGGYAYSAWCVSEPVTHSFTLEGDIVTGSKKV